MLRSFLDEVGRYRIAGWAQDEAQPDAPLSLLILVDDALVARVLANRHRPDLAGAACADHRRPAAGAAARCRLGRDPQPYALVAAARVRGKLCRLARF